MYLLTLKIFYHFFLWGTILCSCIIACIMAKISVLYSVFLLQPIHFRKELVPLLFCSKKNTLLLTETRKRKGVELVILLSYQSQHVRISKANTSCPSARHLKHF